MEKINKLPRKLKKATKKNRILLVDLAKLPKDIDLEDWLKKWRYALKKQVPIFINSYEPTVIKIHKQRHKRNI